MARNLSGHRFSYHHHPCGYSAAPKPGAGGHPGNHADYIAPVSVDHLQRGAW